MKHLLIFESAVQSELFREWGYETLAFASLLARLGVPAFGEEIGRLESFRALVPSEGEPEKTLATIDLLRDALVKSSEDAEYVFQILPTTPKNQALKASLLAYLASPLREDRAHHLWSLIEALKNHEVRFSERCRLTFVPEAAGSYLFREVAQSFLYAEGVEAVETLPLWELQTAGSRKVPVLQSSPGQCLSRIADAAAAHYHRGQKVVIPFAGSRAQHTLFVLLAKQRGVPVRSLVPFEEAVNEPKAPLSDLIEKLRRDPARDLKDRLRLSALLLSKATGKRASTELSAFLDRLVTQEVLEPGEREYLATLTGGEARIDSGPPEENKANAVLVVPFGGYPSLPGRFTLAYLGKEALVPPASLGLLKPAEAEALHGAGFPVRRAGDYRAAREKALEGFLSFSRGRLLFTPLEKDDVPATRFLTLSPRLTEIKPEPPLEEISLPDRHFSATQLEAYARCPAQYLFSHRLRLRKLTGEESQYALLFGQATHAALENSLKQQPDRSLLGEETLVAEFETALKKLAPGLEPGHPLFTILNENFRKVARRVSELEKNLQGMFGETQPFAFERDFLLDLGNVTVKGQIDRIDRVGGSPGELLVLDYKTGNVDFTPDHIVKGNHFQALIYLLAVEVLYPEACAGMLFYDLKKGETRRGMLRSEHVPESARKGATRGHAMIEEKYAAIREEGLRRLKEVTTLIRKGSFPPNPSPSTCGFCDYAALCRKGHAFG